jgi:hypothetical protein
MIAVATEETHRWPLQEQARITSTKMLRGYDAYYGIAENIGALRSSIVPGRVMGAKCRVAGAGRAKV